jgi:two-component system cell cycle sensor histidine kinase/response regulator CckA
MMPSVPLPNRAVPGRDDPLARSFGSLVTVLLLGHLAAFLAWYDDIGQLAGAFVLPAAILFAHQRGTRGAVGALIWSLFWGAFLGATLPAADGQALGLARTLLSTHYVLGHALLSLLLLVLGRQSDLERELAATRHKLARTEEALRDAEHMREEARLTQRLSRAERLASVGALASGVAHEINNPLTYVIGNLYYALEELERDTDTRTNAQKELGELVRDALDGAQRVRRIVRDLKTFSRATDDDSQQRIDVNASISAAVNLMNNEIRHRARLLLVLSDVPHVLGSEPKLMQVLVNLLMNAAQAIPEGDADRALIEVRSYAEEKGRVRIDFRDTGVGMSKEVLAHVFDPFFTTKPAAAGAGLGLSVANGIVESMGGEISVESREGEGSTFSVILRGEQGPVSIKSPRRTPPAPRSGRLRVLVIDDEPKVGVSLSRMLRDWDVQVIADGREALTLLQRDRAFDAVLCDLMMPQMSGMDLYESVRVQDPTLAKRFVFMTGGAFTPRARAFVDEVSNTTLEKPFDKALLLNAVESLVRVQGS